MTKDYIRAEIEAKVMKIGMRGYRSVKVTSLKKNQFISIKVIIMQIFKDLT